MALLAKVVVDRVSMFVGQVLDDIAYGALFRPSACCHLCFTVLVVYFF